MSAGASRPTCDQCSTPYIVDATNWVADCDCAGTDERPMIALVEVSKPGELDYVVTCGPKNFRCADLGEALVEAFDESVLNGQPATIHSNGALMATVTAS